MCFFLLNDPATTEIYPLPLHDALPISLRQRDDKGVVAALPVRLGFRAGGALGVRDRGLPRPRRHAAHRQPVGDAPRRTRSEEHTSELQSRQYLVCRLLLEKKNISFRTV